MLLYNAAGQFTGYQLGTYNSPALGTQKLYAIYDKDYDNETKVFYTLTAYTRDPETICSASQSDLPIGDRVWIKIGISNQYLQLPLTQSEADQSGVWVEGKCFWSMGKHYWYNLTATTSCDELHPMFALYNRSKLNAFGFVIAKLPEEPGSRWEHPSGSALKMFLPDSAQPSCLFANGLVMSTQHVYFTIPEIDFC